MDLDAADTAKLMGKTTQNALPVIEEVSVSTVSQIYIYSVMFFDDLAAFLNSWLFLQVARLQNSMIFKAARSLDFQRDMIGSINMLLCEKQPDFNSTNMPIGLHSRRQMVNNIADSIMGNSSGKCCSKLLYKAKLSHSTCVLIIYPHFSFTVLCVVMVARKWTNLFVFFSNQWSTV